MENKGVIIGIALFFVLMIYFYFFALFLEKNLLLLLPVFGYLMFFVARESKIEREELDKRLLPRKGKMKFDWR